MYFTLSQLASTSDRNIKFMAPVFKCKPPFDKIYLSLYLYGNETSSSFPFTYSYEYDRFSFRRVEVT